MDKTSASVAALRDGVGSGQYDCEILRLPQRTLPLVERGVCEGTPFDITPYVLSTKCAKLGAPIRRAVSLLQGTKRIDERSAWNLCAKWILGITAGQLSLHSTLIDAEQWFGDASIAPRISTVDRTKVEAELRAHADTALWSTLLPYLLDPHGPGSRLSVRAAPETQGARARKKAEGVFYTPPDVAEFIVTRLLGQDPDSLSTRTILDPACGTGAFLRAALKKLRAHSTKDPLKLASSCFFGIDISQWALDASAYVLLHDCLIGSTAFTTRPAVSWAAIRENLRCVDALSVRGAQRMPACPKLPFGKKTGALDFDPTARAKDLGQLFPKLANGVDFVLGNPPYCSVGERPDLRFLSESFVTLGYPNANAEIHPLFLEQMISFVGENGGGAFVLPLSIAFNSGKQFSACRELIRRTPGMWSFAFFDREPHALFGEHVKTRSAIVFWHKGQPTEPSTIYSGPLRKWRGPERSAMFSEIRFTRIDADIAEGIPKIDGFTQTASLEKLRKTGSSLKDSVRVIGRCQLSDTPAFDATHLFVGPTAYNFINTFLSTVSPRRDNSPLSENAHHRIECRSPRDALTIFAILSSRLAFWWWHVYGDGFHVARKFLSDFPIALDAIGEDAQKELSQLGSKLWRHMRKKPIISRNSGKTSFAFSPLPHTSERDAIDDLLIAQFGLDVGFKKEVDRFVRRIVTADPNAE